MCQPFLRWWWGQSVRSATQFPSPLGLKPTFNPSTWQKHAETANSPPRLPVSVSRFTQLLPFFQCFFKDPPTPIPIPIPSAVLLRHRHSIQDPRAMRVPVRAQDLEEFAAALLEVHVKTACAPNQIHETKRILWDLKVMSLWSHLGLPINFHCLVTPRDFRTCFLERYL